MAIPTPAEQAYLDRGNNPPPKQQEMHPEQSKSGVTDGADHRRTSQTPPRIWPDATPVNCPIPKSQQFCGIAFTGRHAEYTTADTWYPSWASDDAMYSPFTDGTVNGMRSNSTAKYPNVKNLPTWVTGAAKIEGDDPLKLKVTAIGLHQSLAAPYIGRYPCGSLVHNGVWYYGTYCLDYYKHNMDVMGPFVGFRMSRDAGQTWQETPRTPAQPLFGEIIKPPDARLSEYYKPNVTAAEFAKMPKVKMGAPHFVDFGKNMEHSPDGKAYLIAHGASRACANCSWISGDQIYLARVTPSPETMNEIGAYEFFGGHDKKGAPVWVKDFAKIKPLLEWNEHLGCVTATWNPILQRYFLCTTDGGPTGEGAFHTLILESEHITGPWRRVALLKNFGKQAYFVNFPSKFIRGDGRTMWLCYSANYPVNPRQPSDPPGSVYAMCLQEIRLCAPDSKSATT